MNQKAVDKRSKHQHQKYVKTGKKRNLKSLTKRKGSQRQIHQKNENERSQTRIGKRNKL
jgi:hypothetical protein